MIPPFGFLWRERAVVVVLSVLAAVGLLSVIPGATAWVPYQLLNRAGLFPAAPSWAVAVQSLVVLIGVLAAYARAWPITVVGLLSALIVMTRVGALTAVVAVLMGILMALRPGAFSSESGLPRVKVEDPWKCPECRAVLDGSILQCVCGHSRADADGRPVEG